MDVGISRQRAWATFLALCVVWGIPYFFIKLAVAEVPAVVVAFARLALGTVILMPIAWRQGALGSLRGRRWAIGAFALAELTLPFVLIAYGEGWVSSSLAGILIATLPLIVPLVAPLFGVREVLDARRIAGLVLGFAGVVALLGIDPVAGPGGWAGVACLFAATVSMQQVLSSRNDTSRERASSERRR
jgi:drug/metabolite transporter (DMT)-like permease